MVCDEVIVLKGKTRLTCAELSGSVIIRTRQGETDLSLVKLNLGYSLKMDDFVDMCRIVRASLRIREAEMGQCLVKLNLK